MIATQTVEREIVVAAPVQRVWDVLTEPQHIGQWFGSRAELEPRVGGDGVLEFEGHGAFKISVVRFDPTSHFSYRWANKIGTEAVPGLSTLVEFTLEPAGDGTKLRVVESGLSAQDTVIVDGVQKVFFPGMPVVPKQVAMGAPAASPAVAMK